MIGHGWGGGRKEGETNNTEKDNRKMWEEGLV